MGWEVIILIVYGLALLFIFLYSLIQIQLVYHYIRRKKGVNEYQSFLENVDEWPFVTIQLPVYNEKYVVERLIRNAAKIDYPKDKFEIQVLDDSNDETIDIVNELCNEISGEGINIKQVRRESREGFKAGALAHGLTIAEGEFFAIFRYIPSGI